MTSVMPVEHSSLSFLKLMLQITVRNISVEPK